MRYLAESPNHTATLLVTIKDRYVGLEDLENEVSSCSPDAPYACRKLREIRAALCGAMECPCRITLSPAPSERVPWTVYTVSGQKVTETPATATRQGIKRVLTNLKKRNRAAMAVRGA